MLQQLQRRDLGRMGQPGKEARYRRLQIEPPGIDQPQQRRGGEALAQRADAKPRRRLVRQAMRRIGQAARGLEQPPVRPQQRDAALQTAALAPGVQMDSQAAIGLGVQ